MIFVVLFLAVAFLFGAKAQDDKSAGRDVVNEKGRNQQRQSLVSCGMPGMPGSNGMPGMPGVPGPPGRDGSKGENGDHGPQGLRGVTGETGKVGPKGGKGSKGETGKDGTKGAKGEQARTEALQQANWKQCVWDSKEQTDDGKIRGCTFKKLYEDTALKVSFYGNLLVLGDRACNRWFFKFNGNECFGPSKIEAAIYNDWSSGNPYLYHHRSFAGYCKYLPQGSVTVELWVGKCRAGALGDAYTGWISVSRIMIEEVPSSQ